VNEEGQGEDVVIHAPLASHQLAGGTPQDRFRSQQRTARRTGEKSPRGVPREVAIGADYGAELARLIEPTAPELAYQVRSSLTSEQTTKLITCLWAVLQLIIAPMDLLVININIEQNETTTININLPPPAPPTGEGPNG
jgi:hypothetical protein